MATLTEDLTQPIAEERIERILETWRRMATAGPAHRAMLEQEVAEDVARLMLADPTGLASLIADEHVRLLQDDASWEARNRSWRGRMDYALAQNAGIRTIIEDVLHTIAERHRAATGAATLEVPGLRALHQIKTTKTTKPTIAITDHAAFLAALPADVAAQTGDDAVVRRKDAPPPEVNVAAAKKYAEAYLTETGAEFAGVTVTPAGLVTSKVTHEEI